MPDQPEKPFKRTTETPELEFTFDDERTDGDDDSGEESGDGTGSGGQASFALDVPEPPVPEGGESLGPLPPKGAKIAGEKNLKRQEAAGAEASGRDRGDSAGDTGMGLESEIDSSLAGLGAETPPSDPTVIPSEGETSFPSVDDGLDGGGDGVEPLSVMVGLLDQSAASHKPTTPSAASVGSGAVARVAGVAAGVAGAAALTAKAAQSAPVKTRLYGGDAGTGVGGAHAQAPAQRINPVSLQDLAQVQVQQSSPQAGGTAAPTAPAQNAYAAEAEAMRPADRTVPAEKALSNAEFHSPEIDSQKFGALRRSEIENDRGAGMSMAFFGDASAPTAFSLALNDIYVALGADTFANVSAERQAGWDAKRLEQKQNSADMTAAPVAPQMTPDPAPRQQPQINLGPGVP